MFQPRYLKHAKLLYKGVTRFLHYKRDILAPGKLTEIAGLRTELEQAIKARNKQRIDELTETLNRTCERALPQAKNSDLAENVEVFFVSIVIALGIRAYIAQPFQIPTGSMQPTLNGIMAERTADDPNPGLVGKALGFFTGTSYLNAVSDHDGFIDRRQAITEHRFLIFRPTCKLHFEDGHVIKINSPQRQLVGELGLWDNLGGRTERRSSVNPDMRDEVTLAGDRIHVKKGQLLARGIVTNGDHVIVNKFAYHFRKPTRGEVFVFTTKNIRGIEGGPGYDTSMGSQHYIKRLTGVPGDLLEVRSPDLYINGSPAIEAGIRRVVDEAVADLGTYAYHGYSPHRSLSMPVELSMEPRRQYFAMGDNSYNSSDSRYWGPVPEQNLVGPGWICYWPLTRHWGFIK